MMDNLNDQALTGGIVMRATNRAAKMTRVVVFMLVLASALSWVRSASASPAYSDRVAAVVNGDVILESEVKEQKQPFVRQNFSMPLGVVPPGKWPTEKEVLDELIVMRLLEQEADKKGIQMNDQGLDAAIKSLRERNKMPFDKFIMFLAAKGLNYVDYRKMMKRQMVLSALINREMAQRAQVSDKDGQEYFKENKGKIDDQFDKLVERISSSPEPQEEEKPKVPTYKEVYIGGKVRLRQIVLKMIDPANKKEKEKVIQTVRKIFEEVKAGADFAQLAKKYSQDSTSSKGGDLGYLDYKDMHPNMQKMVQQMKVGEVAPPLSTRNAVIILNLAEEKNRKLSKVPIPAADRKKLEKQIEEMYEKRKAERERALAQERTARKAQRDTPESGEKEAAKDDGKKKPDQDAGILDAEDKKEYEKVRDKIRAILRAQRVQGAMKEWVEDLKKNSIIEVRL